VRTEPYSVAKSAAVHALVFAVLYGCLGALVGASYARRFNRQRIEGV